MKKQLFLLFSIFFLFYMSLMSPLNALQAGDVDLEITPNGVSFSNDNPLEGEKINIDVVLQNNGQAEAQNIRLDFYDIQRSQVVKTHYIDSLPPKEMGGMNQKTFVVQQGIPFYQETLPLSDASYELFGEEILPITGLNVDDGCVSVNLIEWNNIDLAFIKKNTTTSPNQIELFVQSAQQGTMTAEITVQGQKTNPTTIHVTDISVGAKGEHTIYTALDYFNTITETNEYNNFNISSYTVLENNSPLTPLIQGTGYGLLDQPASFVLKSLDPQNNQIKFRIEWGDGGFTETDFLDHGDDGYVTQEVEYTWTNPDQYIISVRAIDSEGNESAVKSHQIKVRDLKNWSVQLVDQGNIHHPVLAKSMFDTLYMAYSQYSTHEDETSLTFMQSGNDGQDFFLDFDSWNFPEKNRLSLDLIVDDDEEKHTVTEYNGNIFYGKYKNNNQFHTVIDSAAPGSYVCLQPKIDHFNGYYACTWIRKGNEDQLYFAITKQVGSNAGVLKVLGDASERFANPDIAFDQNGDLYITAFFFADQVQNPQNNTSIGIKLFKIPYNFDLQTWNWDQVTETVVYENQIQHGSSSMHVNSCPQIAFDLKRNVHVVFDYPDNPMFFENDHYDVVHAKSYDHGITWINTKISTSARKPQIDFQNTTTAQISYLRDHDVYLYNEQTQNEILISSGQGHVQSASSLSVTDQSIQLCWAELNNGISSVYHSRFFLKQFTVSHVHCTPNIRQEWEIPEVDVPGQYTHEYYPKEIFINFQIRNNLNQAFVLGIDIIDPDTNQIVHHLVTDLHEYLDADPHGGYSKQFNSVFSWDGRTNNSPAYYAEEGKTYQIKITVQEYDELLQPGQTITSLDIMGDFDTDYRIIPKDFFSMTSNGQNPGLLGLYNNTIIREHEGPIEHGVDTRFGYEECFYNGHPGYWGDVWEQNAPEPVLGYNIWDQFGIFEETITGFIHAPVTGLYLFKIDADDYASLSINNVNLGIIDDIPQGGTLEGSIYLEGNQWYPIHIEYKNRVDKNKIKLYWNIRKSMNYIHTDPTFIQKPKKNFEAFSQLKRHAVRRKQ